MAKLARTVAKKLTEQQIREWAEEHLARTGKWPGQRSGAVRGQDETWNKIDQCLRGGFRGLPGGSSLRRLLGTTVGTKENFSEDKIMAWAKAHRARFGTWPTKSSGPIPGTYDTWSMVSSAMHYGLRGLKKGGSLSKLFGLSPPLSEEQVKAWAIEHKATTGKWPSVRSTHLHEGESWSTLNNALVRGSRGLPGGSSVSKLVAKLREAESQAATPETPSTEGMVEDEQRH